MRNSDRLVLAAIFTSDAAAHIAMGMLRSNGIPCILDGELANSVMGIQLSPNDGIRLMVMQQNLAQAQELLKQCHDE